MCQRVALPYSELIGGDDRRVLRGEHRGGRVADRGAQQAGERELLLVVEVVLVTEEDHLVGQQRLVDLPRPRPASRSPPRRTPSTRAPIRLPSLVTVTGCVILSSFFEAIVL